MKAYNTLILLLFFGISLEYTPKSLYEYYINTYSVDPVNWAYASKIIDTDGYISDKDAMLQKIYQIEEERHLRLLFVVIWSMDFRYSYKTDAIGQFGDTFTELFYNNNTALIDDSMTIVYSILDRKMRISTGKNVRAVYDDSICVKLLDYNKSWLKHGYYEDHFNKLLDNILNLEQFREQISRWTFWDFLYIIFIIFFFVICCYIGCFERKETEVSVTADEREKLEKINKLLDKMNRYKNREKEIFADNCIICLEPFSDPSKQDAVLNVKEGEDKAEEPLLDKTEKNKTKITLECGHQFHEDCIAQWLLKNSNCPICREEFKDIHSGDEFRKKVVNVQYTFNPHLDFSGLTFTNGRYAYYRTTYDYHFTGGHSTGAATSSAFDRGGGGGSSGW